MTTPISIDHVWLRDACQEIGTSLQAGTKQKLVGTTDVPVADVGMLDPQHPPRLITDDASGELQLVLTYSTQCPVLNAFSQTFSPAPPQPPSEPHVSRLPLHLLLAHASDANSREYYGDVAGVPRPWDASDMTAFDAKGADAEGSTSKPVRVEYTSLGGEDSSARFAVARGLLQEGLVFVTGLPTEVKGSALEPGPNSPELARLASIFGEIRHTFYGSLWDVRSLPSAVSKNIAYTNVDLGLHMDLLYFQNPPRFQFLHMLRNLVRGGQSIFVDAYRVAERIWETDREAWELLAHTPVAYHYQNDGRFYYFRHPVFELPNPEEAHEGPTFSKNGMPRLSAVNYSPPFQAPLHLQHPTMQDEVKRKQFYQAFQLFADLTLSPEFRYERQLNEGECVIFDNRRVLHSRKGFEFLDDGTGVAEEEDKVKRWLKGCYVDGDAIWSSYRVLRRQQRGRQG